jgi:sulfite oxidase
MSMVSFDKHPEIIIHAEQPLNAEPPMNLLREGFITPKELFYVRNHGSLPEIDPDNYRLTVSGLVEQTLELSLEQIKNEFPKDSVMVALSCAGNRREDLMKVIPIPGEIPWYGGAIGNAWWGGVPLREILQAAGVKEVARHVAFEGLDEVEVGESPNFGGSIPLKKAVSPGVLLAYEMNDKPLAPEHGFPLRAVVGGYIGARSVKWLSEITLQEEPSSNYFQAKDYRVFPPYFREEPADFSKGLMLGEMPVNAAICRPMEDETLPAGSVLVHGYAITSGERSIERVDLSTDEGRTWVGADLLEKGKDHPWAWRFWEAELQLDPGQQQIVARALDSAANIQPDDAGSIWNFKGYMNNSWHRVQVSVQ